MLRARRGTQPAHFHAYYQDSTALVAIETGEFLEGSLPSKQAKLVAAWPSCERKSCWPTGSWPRRVNYLSRSNPCDNRSRRESDVQYAVTEWSR